MGHMSRHHNHCEAAEIRDRPCHHPGLNTRSSRCKRRKTSSFRPLSALLTETVAPELLYREAKWSSLVSYGLSLNALQDFLPIDLSLDVKTVRYDTLKVAKRLEAELGEEQSGFAQFLAVCSASIL